MIGRRGFHLFSNFLILIVSIAFALFIAEMSARFYRQANHEIRPMYGVSKDDHVLFEPNFQHKIESNDFSFEIKTNRYGRRDKEWNDQDIVNPDNVVFIGDSFVMGYGVDDDYTLPTLIENLFQTHYQNREVFNFGIGGSISTPEYLRLFEQSTELGINAELILVGIFLGNDFLDKSSAAIRSKKAYTKNNTNNSSRNNPSTNGIFDLNLLANSELLLLTKETIKNSYLLTGLALRIGELFKIEVYRSPSAYIYRHEWSDGEKELFQSRLGYLQSLAERVRASDKKLGVVLFPNKIQVESANLLTGKYYDAEKPNKLILAFCEKINMKCLDLLPDLAGTFSEHGVPQYYPIDRHLNEYGNQLAANKIFKWINETELVSAHGSN